MLGQKPLLHQSQEMRLKLSQQALLTMKLLALPSLDLKASIQEMLEANPALEVRAEPWEVSLERIQEELNEAESPFHDLPSSPELEEALTTELPRDPRETRPNPEVTQDFRLYDSALFDGASDLGEVAYSDPVQTILERTLSTREDLRDHLKEQLIWTPAPPEVKSLAERIIDNLNADGFHIVPPQQLLLPGEDPHTLAAALDLVRGLDPVGTAVTDWRESLLVQMEKLGGFSEEAIRLVRDHSDLLLDPKPRSIAAALRIPVEEIPQVLDEIRVLNPFPGRTFGSESAPEIVPDLFVEERDGEFYVTMNDETVPVLGLNREIVEESQDPELDRQSQSFLKSKIREARSFLQSLVFRQNTLLRVGLAICQHQTEFLRKGPEYLRPLVLSEIAREVGLHPSTVSRATTGKYIQTRWGILELKDFFTRNSGTGGHTKEGIKERIRTVLADWKRRGEKITDARIQAYLKEQGIEIALRTVNKYRREIEDSGH